MTTPPPNPYHPREWSSWTPEQRYVYTERLGMMCDDGPVTKEAHEEAMRNAEALREQGELL